MDIGTDHAYVPAFLVLNGVIPSAIASDVKAGPLNNAKKTIVSNGLEDKIEAILSDGLISIPHEETDFCIAGMGGELIASILEASPWVEVEGNHFVFQPQTHQEDLRRFLFENGYEILKEDVVKDKRHLYLAIEAVYTGEKKAFSEVDCFVGKLPASSSVYKNDYLKYIVKRLGVRYAATHKSEVKELIDGIETYID